MLTIVNGALGTILKCLVKELEELDIRGRVETIQNYNIIKTSHNTEKTPGDLRKLAVTQTPVKDHQLKNSQGVKTTTTTTTTIIIIISPLKLTYIPSLVICVKRFKLVKLLGQGWANFFFGGGGITGLWIIQGLYLLKSKEFSLDSSASVYFSFLEASASRIEQCSGPHEVCEP